MTNVIKKSGNYTALSNQIVQDARLNLRSLGLFLFMWSKPDNWHFTIYNMAIARNVGQDQIKHALQDLKKYGYVKYQKLANGTGVYFLSDKIESHEPEVDNPSLALYEQPPKAKSGKPKCGKSTPISNTILNKGVKLYLSLKEEKEEEQLKWQKFNELLLKKQIKKDKLQELAQANKKNQVLI